MKHRQCFFYSCVKCNLRGDWFQDWFAECCLDFSRDSLWFFLDQLVRSMCSRGSFTRCVKIRHGTTSRWDSGLDSGWLPSSYWWWLLMLALTFAISQGAKICTSNFCGHFAVRVSKNSVIFNVWLCQLFRYPLFQIHRGVIRHSHCFHIHFQCLQEIDGYTGHKHYSWRIKLWKLQLHYQELNPNHARKHHQDLLRRKQWNMGERNFDWWKLCRTITLIR